MPPKRLFHPEEEPKQRVSTILDKETSAIVADVVAAMRAMLTSMGMYPPGSATVKSAAEKVLQEFTVLFERLPAVRISESQGRLLVDAKNIHERFRKKEAVMRFADEMSNQGFQTILFQEGTTPEEVIELMTLMSMDDTSLSEVSSFEEYFAEHGVTHIEIIERSFMEADQFEMTAREELIRSITNEAGFDPNNFDYENFKEILNDAAQMKEVMSELVPMFEEEKQLSRQEKVEKMRESLANVGNLLSVTQTDEERANVLDSLRGELAKFESEDIAAVILDQVETPNELSTQLLSEDFPVQVGEEKTLGIIDHLVMQIEELSGEMTGMSGEEQERKIGAVREAVKFMVQATKNNDIFPQVGKRLVESGIIKGKLAQQVQKQVIFHEKRLRAKELSRIRLDNGEINETGLTITVRNFERFNEAKLVEIREDLIYAMPTLAKMVIVSEFVLKICERLQEEKKPTETVVILLDLARSLATELVLAKNYRPAIKVLSALGDMASEDAGLPPAIVKKASATLAKICDDDMLDHLIAALVEGSEQSFQAMVMIADQLSKTMLPKLFETLKRTGDRKKRLAILKLLPRMGMDVLAMAKDELAKPDSEWYVIRNMILLVGELGAEEEVELLEPYLTHADARVRYEAIKGSCAKMGGKALDFLTKYIHDEDISVKRLVISLLGELKMKRGEPVLAQILEKRTKVQKEEEDSLQIDAINALLKIGGPNAGSLLMEVAKKEGLLSTKTTKPDSVRAKACLALGQLGDKRALSILQKASKDANEEVATAARAAVSRLGG